MVLVQQLLLEDLKGCDVHASKRDDAQLHNNNAAVSSL